MTRRILVVDDEPATNALAAEYLRLAGFEVVQLYDGSAALEALGKDASFALIIVDKKMPGVGGVETCLALTRDPRTSSIPVILVSASGHPKEQDIPVGAAAFLAKPFSPKVLLGLVQELLK